MRADARLKIMRKLLDAKALLIEASNIAENEDRLARQLLDDQLDELEDIYQYVEGEE